MKFKTIDTAKEEELVCLFNNYKDSVHKYQVEVRLERRVSVPLYGKGAYYIDSISAYFPYGKGKIYPSSNAAVKELTKLVEPFLSLCNSCYITVLRGGSGKVITIKDDQETLYNTSFAKR